MRALAARGAEDGALHRAQGRGMMRYMVKATALLTLALVIGLFGWMRVPAAGHLPFVERLLTRWVPPQAPAAAAVVSETERKALASLAGQVGGFLVWSSNREGNHELYLAQLETGRVQRLTNNPHVDFFSRFSPTEPHFLPA